MNPYTLSKIIATFFGATTVALFFMASGGALFTYARSVQAGVVIYLVNTACLIVSLLVFIWLRARKNMPKQQERQTLEAYAALHSTDQEDTIQPAPTQTSSQAHRNPPADPPDSNITL